MELEDTGSKLRVEETRFRPNFLIKGDFPGFQEDKWVMASRSTDGVVHISLALGGLMSRLGTLCSGM